MIPERLADIREFDKECRPYTLMHDGVLAVVASHRRELLAYIDDLTSQLEDARRMVVDSGWFQSEAGDESTERHALDGCGSCRECRPQDAGRRMFLCTTCGNKRCPHATSCENECTGSNEPGQTGSVYF